jgi:putative ABC transport system permease protein
LSAQTGTPVAKALQQEFPDVESTLRLASWASFPVHYEDKAFTEDKLIACRLKLLPLFQLQTDRWQSG